MKQIEINDWYYPEILNFPPFLLHRELKNIVAHEEYI